MLKGKIHRATVTEANLDYVGSLTLDENLMIAAGLREFEKIQVLNITNGNRLETYVIKGKAGTGQVCINGAAAHLVGIGDLVIIVSYCQLSRENIINHVPEIVHVNEENKIIDKHIESISNG
tara:strand:- start:2362 stop:2727 length:366 start_codon:yes stop_codon:yes gene_type:complete